MKAPSATDKKNADLFREQVLEVAEKFTDSHPVVIVTPLINQRLRVKVYGVLSCESRHKIISEIETVWTKHDFSAATLYFYELRRVIDKGSSKEWVDENLLSEHEID
jgi:hypothetical protein